MELRFARPDEKSTIIEMWQYCFSDKEPFLSWYFDNKYTNENTLVGVVEGKLVCLKLGARDTWISCFENQLRY